MPRLLVDNDFFCKLGIAGLLKEAATIFGLTESDCACLPSLQYMLRKKKMQQAFGEKECEQLVPLAKVLAVDLSPSATWLDLLVGVDRIDVGEAQLLATVAEHGDRLLTGDKRALAAVAQLPGYVPVLADRIVTMEAALISLCVRLGDDVVRTAAQPLTARDTTARICFSPGNKDPQAALRSYFDALKGEVAPLKLWEPLVKKAS